MRTLRAMILSLTVLALATTGATSQEKQPRPGRGPVRGGPSAFGTIRQKSVMDELKLTGEQVDKLKEAMTEMRDQLLKFIEDGERAKAVALMKEREKGLFKILTPEQGKRLKEIVLQVHGVWAMTEPETAKALGITEEQQKKLRDLQEETEKQMNKLYSGGAASRTEAQKKTVELHNSANEKGLAVLTEEQRAKWKQMTGAPFKGEIRRGPPGGR